MSPVSNGGSVPDKLICAACGMEIRVWDDEEARQPIPEQFDTWTHEGECERRFWEAPGEFAEWDSEVYG